MWEPFENTPSDRNALHALARLSKIPSQLMHQLFVRSGIYPEKDKWLLWLDRLLLGLGVLFGLCGIIFLLAFNWDDLSKFTKLGIAEVGLVLATIMLLKKPNKSFAQQMGVTIFCVLTGVLFALFGQIYQTGANAFDFFFNWTLTILPFVILARFQPLWLIWLGLLNGTLYFYADQVALAEDFNPIILTLIGINTLALVIWEYLASKASEMDRQWWPRIVGLVVIILITVQFSVSIFRPVDKIGFEWAFIIAWLVLIPLGIGYYYLQKNIFFLSILFLSIVYSATAFCFRLLEPKNVLQDGESTYLISGLVCIGLTTFFIRLLYKIRK